MLKNLSTFCRSFLLPFHMATRGWCYWVKKWKMIFVANWESLASRLCWTIVSGQKKCLFCTYKTNRSYKNIIKLAEKILQRPARNACVLPKPQKTGKHGLPTNLIESVHLILIITWYIVTRNISWFVWTLLDVMLKLYCMHYELLSGLLCLNVWMAKKCFKTAYKLSIKPVWQKLKIPIWLSRNACIRRSTSHELLDSFFLFAG